MSLHTYLNPTFLPSPITQNRVEYIRWNWANDFVCSVLTSRMASEAQTQLGHLTSAAKMWTKARHLYVDTTATDWILTITALVTTRHTDGEDATEHIAKMKALCRDLILMNHDIPDKLFACFLCISMPPSWNHVFSALPEHYTSIKIERRIRDEYGIHASQAMSLSSFHASKTGKEGNKEKVYCKYHKLKSHRMEDCCAAKSKKKKGKSKEDEKDKPSKSKDDESKAKTSDTKPKPNCGK